MRPAVLRAYALGILSGGFLTAGVILLAGPAKADGYIDPTEDAYIGLYGPTICTVIDTHHSIGGVLGVAEAIIADGFAPDSAVDIINGAVQSGCPHNWALLQAVGRAART